MPTKLSDTETQCVDFRYDEGLRGRKDSEIVATLTTKSHGYSGQPMVATRERESETMNLRIRKLTPCECIKLMGFTEQDYQAMRDIGMSDSQIYHCAGDSIVCSIPAALLGVMHLEETELKQRLEDYIERVKNG